MDFTAELLCLSWSTVLIITTLSQTNVGHGRDKMALKHR